ncbi:hypothetical protein DFH08DRAFT_804113 [Mycena albidolilacea]|uniref:Uncharacterized protein n=1 Tax=Mycena albidolilacea TaxID=1033008 RepID=A0AAD7EY71_9AGAR|nr:hypothetical protein DFH08DRAFT_804113 [Mycena albidolilacea]
MKNALDPPHQQGTNMFFLSTAGQRQGGVRPDPGCYEARQYPATIKAQFSKMATTMYGPLGPALDTIWQKDVQQLGKATCHKCSSLHSYRTMGIVNLVKTHLDKEGCMTAQAKKDKQLHKNVEQPVTLTIQLCLRQRRGGWQRVPSLPYMEITWYELGGWFKESGEKTKTGVCSSICRKVPPWLEFLNEEVVYLQVGEAVVVAQVLRHICERYVHLEGTISWASRVCWETYQDGNIGNGAPSNLSTHVEDFADRFGLVLGRIRASEHGLVALQNISAHMCKKKI